jgi:RNA polymerase sigma-70 factor (ECF subfamily)
MERQREEHAARGRGERFEHLQEHHGGGESERSYADEARALDMSEGAVKVAIHRLRQRFRELLRREILETLDDPSDVEDEIHALFAAFG